MRSVLLFGCALAAACARPAAVQDGAQVAMEFTLSVDGRVVDSAARPQPLRFRVGSGAVLRGLEQAMAGMKAGEERAFVLLPEQGYGPSDPAKVRRMPLALFKDLNAPVKPGLSVSGLLPGGGTATAQVVAVSKTEATLDFNHPLAGKTLDVKVRVLSVE